MKMISKGQFQGTAVEFKAQIAARIQAFLDAIAAHASTVGQPAPREDDLIEELARTGEEYDVVPDPTVDPMPQEVLDEIARMNAVRADTLAADLIAQLSGATPAQISNFVDSNVNDLVDARLMFKRILLVLSLVVR